MVNKNLTILGEGSKTLLRTAKSDLMFRVTKYKKVRFSHLKIEDRRNNLSRELLPERSASSQSSAGERRGAKMKRCILMAIVISMGSALTTQSVFSATHYVSPRGDRNNSGRQTDPWQSISYACGRLKAGDVLIIKPGDYGVERRITFTNNGRRDAPIVVKADEPESVILRGGGLI